LREKKRKDKELTKKEVEEKGISRKKKITTIDYLLTTTKTGC